MDESSYFPEEQLNTIHESITVAEYKEWLRTTDFSDISQVNRSPSFRSAQAPWFPYVLNANQLYQSNGFTTSGWRYGSFVFYPQRGTGDYLFWQAIGDSGLVINGNGFNTTLQDGSYIPINSKSGTYFKTYNPVPGSYYIVSNPT